MTRTEKLLYRLILAELLSCHPTPLSLSTLRLQGVTKHRVNCQKVIDIMLEQQVIVMSHLGEITLPPESNLIKQIEHANAPDLAQVE
ncbi:MULTISPECIES: hypothetical protein [unclassified Pseudoalteromonas]|uniref:hypothetical protein n=1 Tax=unclassified Pseudoalteromonas TaxID=194690 RepID=UPI002097CC00|nr:hypothetical protein [Pseudoalteromonas sp. XMcav2-N]MCO7189021.1 hypothetical protein [Pseudoalteromonas sp. XMcav2-N]